MRQLKNFRQEESPVPSADKYAGMNEEQLTAELMRTVAAARNNGSFSPEELDDFVAFVSPSLDDDARRRLAELVSLIKGG